MNCWNCGETIDLRLFGGIQKTDECPQCKSDLHVCRNCRFFNPSAENECDETQAEWVRYKDRANFCDYFDPAETLNLSRKAGPTADDARKAWEKLFKK